MAASSAFKLFHGFRSANIHLSRLFVFRNISHDNCLWTKSETNNKLTGMKMATLNKKLGIPEMPKRPLTPFLTFRKSVLHDLKKSNPNISQVGISKLAADKWQSVPIEEKQLLSVNFQEAYQTYKKEMDEYTKSLTPEQKVIIKEYDENLKTSKEEKLIKVMREHRLKELNKPKLPAAAFFKFLHEHKRDKLVLRKDFTKMVAQKWEQLPESKKQEYLDAYAKEKKVFMKKISEWEEKMLKEGNIDVVRHKTIKEKLKQCS